MATASKIEKRTLEFTLVLTNEEAHELFYYLAARSTYPQTAGARCTANIYEALRKTLN